MQNSISVLIPDGESEFALFAAHCLAPFPDIKLHVLSSEPWAPIRFSRYRHSFIYRRPSQDDASRLEMLADVAKQYHIDVLLPTETKSISFVVAHRQSLAEFVALPPLPDDESFALANNKWRLAQFLEAAHIPSPPTVLLTCDANFEHQARNLSFPVLLKPVSAWGGDGIERFEDWPSLERFIEERDPQRLAGKYIVQSFLPGYVVGVNVLAREGTLLATTMQRGIIKNTHKFAAAGGIEFIREEPFMDITNRLLTELNWSGFANLDTLCDARDGELKILEINARFWGSLRSSLVARVSFPYLACLAALKTPFPVPDYRPARYIHPQTALRQAIRGAAGRDGGVHFRFDETGWKFLLSDPLAEATRAFRQEFLSPPVVPA